MNITTQGLRKLELEELLEVNKLIVAVIREKQSQKALKLTLNFNVGDKVRLTGRNDHLTGLITKINSKTIVVDCAERGQWKCSPSLLQLVE